jgi:hypothetical protein
MVRIPVRSPRAVGVKTTLIRHEALTARLDPQLLLAAKSPLAAMEVISSEADQELDSVTVWAALAAPRPTFPKTSVALESDGIGVTAFTETVKSLDVPPPGVGVDT